MLTRVNLIIINVVLSSTMEIRCAEVGMEKGIPQGFPQDGFLSLTRVQQEASPHPPTDNAAAATEGT